MAALRPLAETKQSGGVAARRMMGKKERGQVRAKVQVEIPAAAFKEIRTRAYEEEMTQNAVILQALQQAGFSIDDDDLIDRRRG